MEEDTRSVIFVISAALLWGLGGFLSKLGVSSIGPWNAALIRSLFFLPLVQFYVLSREDFEVEFKRVSIYPIAAGLMIGLGIIFVRLSLSFYELSTIKPLQRLSILITVVLGVVILKEKFSIIKGLGIGFAILAFFLLFPLDLSQLGLDSVNLYILGMILSLGLSTVFLRLGIKKNGVNNSRFFRSLVQTIVVVGGVVILFGLEGLYIPVKTEIIYPAINGLLGGIAFILFCKGLEDVDASTAKPFMVLATLTSVALGFILLSETLTIVKIAGIAIAIIAVVLLTTEA